MLRVRRPLRPHPFTAVGVLIGVLASGWALFSAGLVQVTACLPASQGWQVALLRHAPQCPSGVAVDEGGVLAVVGVTALTAVLAHSVAATSLGWAGLWVQRALAAIEGVLDAVLPGRRVPGGCAVLGVRRMVAAVGHAAAGVVRTGRHVVVGLRAPPMPA